MDDLEDLNIPGSFPRGRHRDIPFQSWVAICRNILSGLQDTTEARFPSTTQSRGETNVVPVEGEASSATTLCAEDVEPAPVRKGESHHSDEHTTNEDLPHQVQNDPLSDEMEEMERDIRSITNIQDRRRPVIIVEQPSPPGVPSDESRTDEPLIETQDLTQERELEKLEGNARTPSLDFDNREGAGAIPLVKRVFVSNRPLAESKGNLGSPFEDSGASSIYDIHTPGHRTPALTRVILEDRLLSDYLHSRSQSRHQSERTSDDSSVVARQQLVEGPEERSLSVPLSLNAIPSQVELNGPRDTSQRDTPGPSKSDAISGFSSEPDDNLKEASGASISGPRPRRTSHSFGRAISRSELPDVGEDRVNSDLESDQAQIASIEEVFLFDEESTSLSETSTAVRSRQRSRVSVSREELAQKLQNIQEKTRDNRLPPPEDELVRSSPPPLQGLEAGSESLLSVLARGRRSSINTQQPRMAVPTASDMRRARTQSAVVHFSASQDDLRVNFHPRQAEDERGVVDEKTSEEYDKPLRASQPTKVGLKQKIKEFLSAEARLSRAKPRYREKRKDANR